MTGQRLLLIAFCAIVGGGYSFQASAYAVEAPMPPADETKRIEAQAHATKANSARAAGDMATYEREKAAAEKALKEYLSRDNFGTKPMLLNSKHFAD